MEHLHTSWRRVGALILLALLLTSFMTLAAEPDRPKNPIVMTYTIEEDNAMRCFQIKVHAAALKKLGYTLVPIYAPAARASILADAGHVDGELARVEEYGMWHPELVPVSEHFLVAKFKAYVRSENLHDLTWDKLKKSHLNIGFRRGVKKPEALLAGLGEEQVVKVTDERKALDLLIKGRIDVAICLNWICEPLMVSQAYRKHRIREAGTLDTHKAHAFLNKRHAALAEKLGDMLREMKASGEVRMLMRECGLIP